MLDLATAKAENITGLYFARQMNLQSNPLYSLTEPLATPSVVDASTLGALVAGSLASPSSEYDRDEVTHETCDRRIQLSAFSPRNAMFSAAKRTRAATSTDTPVSSFVAHSKQKKTSDSALSMEPAATPTYTRGRHRRSHSASHFFHLSSLKHHSPAQFNLALCYEYGQGGVERDLERALYYYQQAANQGHTKASYNIGCICYNLGEVSKAMAWFESAGKCSVRGLGTNVLDNSSSTSIRSPLSVQCPIPKQTSLPHELEDMLLGDMATISGPFAAYSPAILCLALLCRKGVRTKEGSTILEVDQEQATELLQKLLPRTPPPTDMDKKGDCHRDSRMRSTYSAHVNRQKRASLDLLKQKNTRRSFVHTGEIAASSPLSTSYPPLRPSLQSQVRTPPHCVSEPMVCNSYSTAHRPFIEEGKRSSGIEDTMDDDKEYEATTGHQQMDPGLTAFSEEPLGMDVHETWSVTLARQLLKAWQQLPAEDPRTLWMEGNRHDLDQRILRHHLLYFTNPTLAKNLYNLGVLYDLYLDEPSVAIKCYRSAYHRSHHLAAAPEERAPTRAHLVTSIRSAWNLGVLHAKQQDWIQAKKRFLQVQQDLILYEHREREMNVGEKDKEFVPHGVSGRGAESLVNVLPGHISVQFIADDSSDQQRAREHGLMIHLSNALVSSSESRNTRKSVSKREKRQREDDIRRDCLQTDVGKVAWVLKWVESKMAHL
ncbi:hypothetical protein BGX28_007429 [Mortierella sp. GBA30]|nr:hypothetical protein BGX28_007429 [Mortierella sp. GBA30]